jgi:hypothetical protein
MLSLVGPDLLAEGLIGAPLVVAQITQDENKREAEKISLMAEEQSPTDLSLIGACGWR